MNKTTRFLGAILLISGTTIGAGMLALPVVTAFGGFWPSIALFAACWLLMLASGLFFLDVNLAIRGEPNLISMAGKTLGLGGKIVSWGFYLLLLYALTAAYIAASTPLFVRAIAAVTGYTLPFWLAPFSLPVLFGGFIYFGTKGVDYINRFLMGGLILSYILLVGFVPSHVHGALLSHFDWPAISIAIPVVVTSFGYHIIIPSLTTYLQHDTKLLRLAIIIGSLIPFLVYLIWQVLVLGVVPLDLLVQSWKKGEAATQPLSVILHQSWIGAAASFFSFFAIVTSFLGVSLSLSDFLTDGFKIKKSWEGRLIACALTFIPPLFFVFTYQRGFYLALEYAGAFVAVLLIILPAIMAWKIPKPTIYHRFWGRFALVAVIVLGCVLVAVDFLQERGVFNSLIAHYVSP